MSKDTHKNKQLESSMELAKIIGKLIADVEVLKSRLKSFESKFRTISDMTITLATHDNDDRELQQKLMGVMFSNPDFIKHASDHAAEITFEDAYKAMVDNPMFDVDGTESPEKLADMKAAFNDVAEMFSFARHEMDMRKTEEE